MAHPVSNVNYSLNFKRIVGVTTLVIFRLIE